MTAHLFCPRCGAHLGRAPACEECGYERPAIERPTPPGQAFWRAKAPGSVGSHLTLAEVDGRAVLLVPWYRRPEYRPSFGGVVALDAHTGTEVWSWQTDGPVEAGVSIAGDVAIVPVRDTVGSGRIIALDLREGQERWRISVPAAVVNTPAVREQRIYFAADDGTLHVVDTRTLREIPGFPRRVTPAAVPIRASPVLLSRGREEIVIVATYGRDFDRVPGEVAAYDVAGREQWRWSAYGNARATSALVGRRLYVTAYRAHPSTGVLSALDAFNGTPLWPQPFQAALLRLLSTPQLDTMVGMEVLPRQLTSHPPTNRRDTIAQGRPPNDHTCVGSATCRRTPPGHAPPPGIRRVHRTALDTGILPIPG